MTSKKLSRRDFLLLSGGTTVGALLAACGPTATPEVITEQVEVTRVVEVEGETVVEEVEVPVEVEVTAPPEPEAVRIEFWSQMYGDAELYLQMLRDMAEQFGEEGNIKVDVEGVNWANAFDTWLLVSQGGVAPDAADMFWLYSHAALGGGDYGPMPITELQPELWPDLEERFYAGALKDAIWQGDFYGIPWRGDIRPMMYRTDFLEEAGLSAPPDTWEEITEFGKALTKRDSAGNVTQWGFEFGTSMPIQQLLGYYWQAGGEYMTPDGKTATIDTPEMRETLEWMYDQIWTHEIVPPDFMESGHTPYENFVAGQVATIGSVPGDVPKNLDRDFPELEGTWAMEIPAKGPANRASYSGAGYWGVLRGTEHPYEAAQWIQFLSRDENMQTITEFTGHVSPNRNVMASAFWTDRPWKLVIGETLEHAHTSQHPSAAWTKLIATNPGAVIYDMYHEALVQKQPIDEVIARAQQRAQEEMDKI